MAFKLAEAFVELGLKTSSFTKGLGNIQSRLKSFAATADGIASKVKGIFLGGGLLGGAIAVTTKLFAEQEKLEARLNAVLKATGGAAGFSADELSRMASSLQAVTTFGDEATMAAQAILLTFRELKGGVFEETIALAQDMATVFGQDLSSAAVQLGKALNDPRTGLTALRRVGISFSEQQKEQIAQFLEANNLMAAQQVILKELREEFGGAAQAEAKTFGGRLAQLKNAVGDLGETIGKSLVPILEDFTKWLTNAAPKIDMMVRQWAEWIATNKDAILSWTAFMVKLGVALIVLPKAVAAVSTMITVVKGLSVAVAFLAANPLVALAGILGTLAATKLVMAKTKMDEFKESTEAAAAAAKEFNEATKGTDEFKAGAAKASDPDLAALRRVAESEARAARTRIERLSDPKLRADLIGEGTPKEREAKAKELDEEIAKEKKLLAEALKRQIAIIDEFNKREEERERRSPADVAGGIIRGRRVIPDKAIREELSKLGGGVPGLLERGIGSVRDFLGGTARKIQNQNLANLTQDAGGFFGNLGGRIGRRAAGLAAPVSKGGLFNLQQFGPQLSQAGQFLPGGLGAIAQLAGKGAQLAPEIANLGVSLGEHIGNVLEDARAFREPERPEAQRMGLEEFANNLLTASFNRNSPENETARNTKASVDVLRQIHQRMVQAEGGAALG